MREILEKGYYFSKNELLLLLGLGGIEEIYSIPLPTQTQFDEKNFLSALHQLCKKGFLQWEDALVLSAETEQILLHLRNAQLVLTMVPADGRPQKIYYIAEKGTVRLELPDQKDAIRICLLSTADFLENLFEEIGDSEQIPKTEEDGIRMEKYYDFLVEEKQHILEQEKNSTSADFLQWSRRTNGICAWEIFNVEKKQVQKRLLFLEGTLYSWILERESTAVRLCYDSWQCRAEIKQSMLERLSYGSSI